MDEADRATGWRPRTPSAQVAPELLNAAESVLVKDGRRGLTVRAVAAEAGVADPGHRGDVPRPCGNHPAGAIGLSACCGKSGGQSSGIEQLRG